MGTVSRKLPFGIEFITDLLGITRKVGAADADSWYADCPFCHKKKKFNVNVKKDIWHCPACGEGGGMIQLYAKIRSMDTKEATKELVRIYEGSDAIIKETLSNRKRELQMRPNRQKAAPLEKRDAAYKAVLKELILDPEHRADLQKRGLPDEWIQYYGYKSTPQHNLSDIVQRLTEKGVDLNRIPGFYGGEKKHIVYRKPGIFIPVKTLWGFISGFQIRYDNLPANASEEQKEKYRKYTWFFSADKKDGISISGCENIHHAGFYPGACIKKVCVTEGVLKADIASYFANVPFIGLTGVSNYGRLPAALEELKKLGTENLYICLDMDYQNNPNVYKAMNKIGEICINSGIRTTTLTWPPEYKGIDDFLFYKRSQGLI